MMEKMGCPGFKAAGAACGLKKKAGRKDLGIIYAEVPATVAGLFTRNRVQAAPVLIDRQRVAAGTRSGENAEFREQQVPDVVTVHAQSAALEIERQW